MELKLIQQNWLVFFCPSCSGVLTIVAAHDDMEKTTTSATIHFLCVEMYTINFCHFVGHSSILDSREWQIYLTISHLSALYIWSAMFANASNYNSFSEKEKNIYAVLQINLNWVIIFTHILPKPT